MVAAALVTALAIAAVALAWSKWVPYLHKAVTLSGTHTWKGSSILAVGGVHASNAPSWHAATSFASAYFELVWRALVAALLISAAVSAFVPGSWVARVMNRRTKVGSAAVGGLMSTPSLMCTCCTAPVAATLRREGAGTAAVVAYWLGNPLLNPAVLVFLGFVAPWQWVVTRLAVGLVVVVGGSALVGRLVERDAEQRPAAVPADASRPVDGTWLAGAPRRFVLTLLRLGLILVPEYLVVVLAVGAVRGWLFPVGESGFVHAGVLVVIVAAVVGTLVVIPTGGEIPIVAGLAALGLSLGGVGALLLTLPAVSLPAMAMLVRSLGRRAVGAAAGVVALGGVLAGGLLTALG
ncbi:MAG: permease [Jatrophihabitans sp.]|uniref:permease n=1 Tax=Jatrophihabitans sp. TaxID=1932789 RepID=UPI003F7DC0E5